MNILKEFRDFAMKGSVIDLAIGIIIGGAFGKIVSSLVNDVIMPPLGLLIGGVDFTDLKITLKHQVFDAAGKLTFPAVTLNYGKFIQTAVDFALVAIAIFIVIKAITQFKKKEVAVPEAPKVPSGEEQLLSEIRDILKNKEKSMHPQS